MAQRERRPADGEVDRVLPYRQRFSGPPPDVQIFRSKRGDVLAERLGHGAVGAFTDGADLSVELAGGRSRVDARQRRPHEPFEPLIAQVLVGAWILRVDVERVGESERAPARVEVERPLQRGRQARRARLGFVCGLGLRRRLLRPRERRRQQHRRQQHGAHRRYGWRAFETAAERQVEIDALHALLRLHADERGLRGVQRELALRSRSADRCCPPGTGSGRCRRRAGCRRASAVRIVSRSRAAISAASALSTSPNARRPTAA